MQGFVELCTGDISTADIDGEVHAAGASVNHFSINPDKVADGNGPEKINIVNKSCHSAFAALTGGVVVAGLIKPFHGDTTVHLVAKIGICWFGKKEQGYFLLAISMFILVQT